LAAEFYTGSSIGAVRSGDDAFRAIADWVDRRDCRRETAVIVTADHGHFLVLDDAGALIPPERAGRSSV
jgi:alkaline phosphatase